MTRNQFLRFLVLLIALTAVAASCGSDDSGSVEIVDAKFRTTPNDLGAGYLTIENSTDDPITLVGASSPEVGRIELHESTMNDDGVMQMIPRPEGFTVEPGEQISLEPGGKHLMLFDPEPAGDELEITLDFDSLDIVVTAELTDAIGGSDSMDEMEMEMDETGEMEEMDESMETDG